MRVLVSALCVLSLIFWEFAVFSSSSLLFEHFLFLQPKPLQQLSGQICQICGDDVGLTVDGELFVACNECAFPICRTCYEYERCEGSQVCPQCKTRFKRLKGNALFLFSFSSFWGMILSLFTVFFLRVSFGILA